MCNVDKTITLLDSKVDKKNNDLVGNFDHKDYEFKVYGILICLI